MPSAHVFYTNIKHCGFLISAENYRNNVNFFVARELNVYSYGSSLSTKSFQK